MFKVSVIKNNAVVQYAFLETSGEANAWANKLAADKGVGKPERWVTEDKEDISGALESRQRQINLDETITEYRLAAQYEIHMENASSELNQAQLNKTSLAYLASTDWYILREMDGGEACPSDIKAARAAARASIIRS